MTGSVHDIAIVGGGIVGLATARSVLRADPRRRVAVLEKEADVARHQSGHNSGVVHSGIYYRPGSLKARLCSTGRRSILAFAREHDIAFEVTGKLIVATRPDELDELASLEARGRDHGLAVRRLSPAEVAAHEPHVACIAALHVAETAIVDFGEIARKLRDEVLELGGEVRTSTSVVRIEAAGGTHRLDTTGEDVESRVLVNCAGLQADLVARATGVDPPARILPFRGEYMALRPTAAPLVRGLVYPVPDPALPFLGVHLTRGIDGSVHAGPNAVLALAREGYRWRDVAPAELWDALGSPALRHLAARNVAAGANEVLRSLFRRRFVADLQRLVPELRRSDLTRSTAGVRAQAVLPDGSLVDDFLIVERPSELHVINAPSPAATSSLAIGEELARRIGR